MPPDAIDSFIQSVGREYTILVKDPSDFVRDTRVLPVSMQCGVRVDLIFGLLPFEEEAVGRGVRVGAAQRTIRVCTAEDLILMKIISDRPRDLDDARAIVRRRLAALDLAYLEPRVEEMASPMERDDITMRWQEWKAEATGAHDRARTARAPDPE